MGLSSQLLIKNIKEIHIKTNDKVKEILLKLSNKRYFPYALSPEPPTYSRIISGLSFIFINV